MLRNLLKNRNCSVGFYSITSRYVGTSIDKEEIAKFSKLAKNWWDINGDFKLLHTMNKVRIPFIKDGLQKHSDAPVHEPLRGLKIVDVGCGGGILSEPLSRLGAEVIGLDASSENIETAKYHASLDPTLSNKNLTYVSLPVEDFLFSKENKSGQKYDGVILSEIVEHVLDVGNFLKASCSLVKPGGSIFITTINKTWLSYLLAIVAAERIFQFAPKGIHDWNKFISPQDVEVILRKNHFEVRLIHGMTLNPLNCKWFWCKDQSVNYVLHAVNYSHDTPSS